MNTDEAIGGQNKKCLCFIVGGNSPAFIHHFVLVIWPRKHHEAKSYAECLRSSEEHSSERFHIVRMVGSFALQANFEKPDGMVPLPSLAHSIREQVKMYTLIGGQL